MSNNRQQMLKEEREKLSLEERQVKAMEQIADSLVFIQGKVIAIEMNTRARPNMGSSYQRS